VICDEHGIDPTGRYRGGAPGGSLQLERIIFYYNEASYGRFILQAMLMDLELRTMDSMRAGPYGQIFRLENLCLTSLGKGINGPRVITLKELSSSILCSM
jgi:tubulin beta